MHIDPSRRLFVAALAALPVLPLSACAGAPAAQADPRFAALERELGGRLGVYAIDTGTGRTLGYRQDERFAMCSTFKAIAAAAVLARSVAEPGLLARRIRISPADLVTYSPVVEKRLEAGMTLEELCAATVIHSDNAAGNLILRELGGPSGLTRFARGIGDPMFRLDRWEPDLNSAIEGDPRDTTTPAAMSASLRNLVLGDALPPAQRRKLAEWLVGCATGAARIRAAAPAGAVVGDKTGTGAFGSANDIGVVWPAGGAPVVLAIYTVRRERDAKARSDVVAAAAGLALAGLRGA